MTSESWNARDYFAAMAMQEWMRLYAPIPNKGETPKEALQTIALASYEMADAMLKAKALVNK